MLKNYEVFSGGDLLDDEAVKKIFDHEEQTFLSANLEDPGEADYISSRRRLLGPTADIMHPEFGRDNSVEETFELVYRFGSYSTLEADQFTKVFHDVSKLVVNEYVYNYLGNLVDV